MEREKSDANTVHNFLNKQTDKLNGKEIKRDQTVIKVSLHCSKRLLFNEYRKAKAVLTEVFKTTSQL